MTTEHFRLQAGWYADPESTGERWWNGSQWTSHTRGTAVGQPAPADPSDLEGQPPVAWSAADHPLATVIDDDAARPAADFTGTDFTGTGFTGTGFTGTGFTGTATVSGSGTLADPVMPAIAPGWYPDPQGLPAQRWWDGVGWSPHTAPVPGPMLSYPNGYRGGYPAVHVPGGGTTVVMMQPRKSVGVALVLTFFFGPFGMFYSTVTGALIMLAAMIFGGALVGVLTFGLGWLVWWPFVWVVSMIWGCLAAAHRPAVPVVQHYR